MVGAGHTHLGVLRRWHTHSVDSCHLRLINPETELFYSAMVPGVIAGHYSQQQAKIELAAFCGRLGIEFTPGRMAAFSPNSQEIVLSDGSSIPYDLLSLNIGSVPRQIPVSGAVCVPVKPFSNLINTLEQQFQQLAHCQQHYHWAVLGAGAAGVEIVLAIHQRLLGLGRRSQVRLSLVDRRKPLSSHPPRAQQAAATAIASAGIHIINHQVEAVEVGKIPGLASLPTVNLVVLATGAQADPLLSQQPLGPDGAMIAVDDRLQVKALNQVFASGDIADFPQPQPKNGVIAVRQAATLQQNLLASLGERDYSQPFQPPKSVMNLLSYSNGQALMSHRRVVAQGRWVWWLKRWIDTRYMKNWV